jgi:spore maturation protein CgeB
MACGIPLISSPWKDEEGLFSPGKDFLMAKNGQEMKELMKKLLTDTDFALSMALRAYKTILKRHTCAQRAEELEMIIEQLEINKKGEKAMLKNTAEL